MLGIVYTAALWHLPAGTGRSGTTSARLGVWARFAVSCQGERGVATLSYVYPFARIRSGRNACLAFFQCLGYNTSDASQGSWGLAWKKGEIRMRKKKKKKKEERNPKTSGSISFISWRVLGLGYREDVCMYVVMRKRNRALLRRDSPYQWYIHTFLKLE